MNKRVAMWGIGILASLLIIGYFLPSSSQEEVVYSQISLKKVKGLQDCQLIAIEADGNKIYVIRCPNSDVSTHWIKNAKNFFVHTTEGLV